MRIAFVTPELQPLVRRTNLAETVDSLARTLRKAGHDARVILPFTKDVKAAGLLSLQELGQVKVPCDKTRRTLTVFAADFEGLPVVLIDEARLFRSRHPYGDENGPYPDNWKRFAVFARAVLEALPLLDYKPEVLHCMDWTTGLIPVFRELEYVEQQPEHPASKAGVYFGITNLAMQGTFEREILPKIGLPPGLFQNVRGVEHGGRVNYLKAGAEFATIIGANSPSMALRIQQQDRGYGLEETFQRRKKELVGVTNGIDYNTWDPSNDPLLSVTYSVKDRDLNGKRRNKAHLQRVLNLDNGPRTPVAAVIGRFDADSGFDLLAEIMTAVLERTFQVVMLGAGQQEIIERIKTIESTFTGRCRLIEGYDVQTAHMLLGGADLLMLPSHHQPSNALCAIGMRYGTVPLIYEHSGLEDTVVGQNENPRGFTGFTFARYNGEGLLAGMEEVRKVYKSADDWRKLALRCMKQDFSWEQTGAEYVKAYRRVTRRVKAELAED
ncbi:MAG: glycogen synthase [Planctomycetes bacterium]|nr:glycogen synthase [Planctomycetota bacterium]